ncbi:MAG: AraC family transcriptional regulator [Myxococcota bacterium]|nr:AraC family transcriptional regulator [Myxococcota bacterium]
MDVLADIVAGLELRSSLYFRAEFTTPFAVAVPEDRRRIRFHVAGVGRSWIRVASGESVFYEHGDLILVPHGAAHVLASEPVTEATPLESIVAGRPPGTREPLRHGGDHGDGYGGAHGDGGAAIELVCGHFEFDETLVHPVVESLPPLVHVKASAGSFDWMPPLLEAVERESRTEVPVSQGVARRLSEILFIQVLRAVMARPGSAPGLLEHLDDPQVAPALRAIHADPARDWSLESLASVAGASRSVFADRFRQRTGRTPMRYLTDWRMQKARRLLANPALSVGDVGRSVGYGSEAAFNRAFREAVGEPPGRHRKSLAG